MGYFSERLDKTETSSSQAHLHYQSPVMDAASFLRIELDRGCC
jgi:hypothetical protein